MRVYSFIHDIFKKYPLLLSVNCLLLFIVSLFEAVAIFALVPIADLLIKTNIQEASTFTRKIAEVMTYFGIPVSIASFVIIFVLFNVLSSAFQILLNHLIIKTKYIVARNLVVSTFDDFFNARWYFFISNHQGILYNTFIKHMIILSTAFERMAHLVTYSAQLILYLIVPFFLSWQVTLISLIVALLFASPFLLLGKFSYRFGVQYTSTSNKIGSIIQESLTLAKVILGFGNQRKVVSLLDDAYDIHRKAAIKSQTLIAAVPLMYYPLALTVALIAALVGYSLAIHLSEIAALLYSLLKAIPYIGRIITQKTMLENFTPSYEQILSLRESACALKQKTGHRLFSGFSNVIDIDNLSFAYPGHRPVLININVHIPKGKMVAFVGKSGGGKSTLIDMIMGFNEPATGRIAIDGVNLKEFDIISYRQRIGYVPQESILFNISILDNLRWAKQSATEQEIQYACRQAYAEEFIKEFPRGYDTVVGDRGVRLSGGQAQRIALARAILRKPDILILDEATSSLDTHSERLIQQAIESIAKETTVIVIAHRISTIVNADYIYVLDKGQIIEEGIYSELLLKDGEFNRMIQLQTLEAEVDER